MFTPELLSNLFSAQAMIGLAVGVIGGVFIGALPGLGATMGIAVLIPITFGMEPAAALIMLTGLYTSAIYGGSITAILLHTPGTPAGAATALDGYQLTLRGEGMRAIGASTIGSMIGGTISAIMLLALAPPLARASLAFSAPEFFLIAVFGLTIIGSLSEGGMAKGLLAGLFGLAISTIGFDEIYGVRRFTYGLTALEAGISLVPALIGLFSISQVLMLAEDLIKREAKKEMGDVSGRVLPSQAEFIAQLPNIVRSAIIGVFVGILPGAGGDIGSWLGYNEAKRFSKNKENFGKGEITGVWAAETANNGVTGGSLIPMMTLGIPGSSAAAVLLGAMMLHGLLPGHGLFTTQADITYAIILGFLIANIMMGIVGLLMAKHVAKVASAPVPILAPVIVVLSVVGSYAINISLMDVNIMVIFGIIGYFMRKTGFATAPIVLAIILGPMAENGFKRAQLMARGENLISFYMGRPLSFVLLAMIVLSLFSPLIMGLVQKKMAGKKPAADGPSDSDTPE